MADRRRVRLRQVDLRQGADGARERRPSGEVLVNGIEVGQLPVRQRQPGLISSLQMVFQNPFDTLNPSHSVGAQIVRVLQEIRRRQDAPRRSSARPANCSTS